MSLFAAPLRSAGRLFGGPSAGLASRRLKSTLVIPHIGDISPTGAEDFNDRQSAFRHRLAADAENKLRQAEQDAKVPPAAEPEPSPASAGAADAAPAAAAKEDKPGRLSSLIYGTVEGRNMERDLERSFSQMLARGKYVHGIVFHKVHPDKVDEYAGLVGEWYPKLAGMPETHMNLVGSWRTAVGDCFTFIHIFEYQRYIGYHTTWATIRENPGYNAFEEKLRTLISDENTSLMQEFEFWPTSPPRKLGGIFELRSYTLRPGHLLEWETHWRRGLAARREVMEGVGAWFVQIGELNTVHHLWQFANLEERRIRREQSWGVKGWGDTVHKTVPLIESMKSRVLLPMPWSPVS